jgi:peroxiredoxin Q/BCP
MYSRRSTPMLAGLALSAAFNLTPLLEAQQAPPVAPPPTALKVGDVAPDFTLPAIDGTKVTLSSFRGKKTVVLAFFPAAFTGG